MWPHGTDKLNHFIQLLNELNLDIKFLMEIKKDGMFPFLNVLSI